jgi:hypothetical protein
MALYLATPYIMDKETMRRAQQEIAPRARSSTGASDHRGEAALVILEEPLQVTSAALAAEAAAMSDLRDAFYRRTGNREPRVDLPEFYRYGGDVDGAVLFVGQDGGLADAVLWVVHPYRREVSAYHQNPDALVQQDPEALLALAEREILLGSLKDADLASEALSWAEAVWRTDQWRFDEFLGIPRDSMG